MLLMLLFGTQAKTGWYPFKIPYTLQRHFTKRALMWKCTYIQRVITVYLFVMKL